MNKHLKTANTLAQALDNQFSIFGFRFGLAPIIGLIPGLGDTIDLLLSMYIVWIALRARAPMSVLTRMLVNIGTNYLIALIPVFGDLTYLLRRVNLKNVQLLKTALGQPEEGRIIS